jgi:hypothetical protein
MATAKFLEDSEWCPFLAFRDRVSAGIVAAILESESVPITIETGSLFAGVEADFCLLVPSSLAHRARWVLAQSDFTDSELNFLATGQLGQHES